MESIVEKIKKPVLRSFSDFQASPNRSDSSSDQYEWKKNKGERSDGGRHSALVWEKEASARNMEKRRSKKRSLKAFTNPGGQESDRTKEIP